MQCNFLKCIYTIGLCIGMFIFLCTLTYIILYYIILYSVTLHYIILYYTFSKWLIMVMDGENTYGHMSSPCYYILYYIILYYIILYYIILYYIILYHYKWYIICVCTTMYKKIKHKDLKYHRSAVKKQITRLTITSMNFIYLLLIFIF